jgi:phage terminase large subunit-like protein
MPPRKPPRPPHGDALPYTDFVIPAGAHYSKGKADHAVNFINTLKHTDGKEAGHTFRLRPWQERIVRIFFGIVNTSTGLRQYRTLYIEIPRKNGKSELAAAIALYLLLGDGEFGAQIYGAAYDRGQASLIFNVAHKMVQLDPTLSNLVRTRTSYKTMEYDRGMSFYMALSKESSSKHGFNAHGIIVDEFHTFKDDGPDSLFDVLSTSQDARAQPVRIIITTAGKPKHNGLETPAYKMHVYALKVRDNPALDPSFLPIIFAAAEDDAWDDQAVWHKANPALGDFKKIDGLINLAREAAEMPAKKATFERLHLNRWTDADAKAISDRVWKENAGDWRMADLGDKTQVPAFLRGRRAFGGLDLASVSDMNALALFFPAERLADGTFSGPHHLFMRFWLPRNTMLKRAEKVHAYKQWAQDGYLSLTEGDVADYAHIRRAISGPGGIDEQVDLQEVAYDRTFSQYLVNDLMDDSIAMVQFGQGFISMNTPSKELERLILCRALSHGANPVMDWMMGNLVWEIDAAENYKPSKKNSLEKIDGPAAAIMAIGRWIASEQEGGSRWNNPGGLRKPPPPTPEA